MTDRNFKTENAEHLSQDTKNNIQNFLETDVAFARKFETFLTSHAEELLELDNLREKRNRVLDEATRGMRRDAGLAPRAKVTNISYGPFSVVKKMSEWYTPEVFVELANRSNIYKAALDSGAIQIKTEIDFDVASKLLDNNKMTAAFAAAYATEELTPAVTAPKDIPPFGSQLKKKQ